MRISTADRTIIGKESLPGGIVAGTGPPRVLIALGGLYLGENMPKELPCNRWHKTQFHCSPPLAEQLFDKSCRVYCQRVADFQELDQIYPPLPLLIF